MDELNLITFSAINNYYNYLDNLGYANYDDINKLVILSFINDIVNTFPQYITNKDYDTIVKTMLYLSKSCFISAPHFLTQESLFKDNTYYKQRTFRMSEDSLFRYTEDDGLRTIN